MKDLIIKLFSLWFDGEKGTNMLVSSLILLKFFSDSLPAATSLLAHLQYNLKYTQIEFFMKPKKKFLFTLNMISK